MSLSLTSVGLPKLLIESWSDSARTVYVKGLIQRLSAGQISEELLNHKHTTNSDRSRAAETIDFPTGLVSLSAILGDATGVRRGQCYVRVSLVVGGTARKDVIFVFFAGYLFDTRDLSYPPGLYESSTSGEGYKTSVTITDPAPVASGDTGGMFSYTIPTNARARLRILRADYTTSSTPGNRTVEIRILDPTGNIIYTIVSPTITASQGRTVILGELGFTETSYDAAGRIRLGLPLDNRLFQGWQIVSSVTGRLMADDFSNIFAELELWIEE